MNHHFGRVDEAERWEEHRELRDPIGKTRPPGQRESDSTVRNPGFRKPLSSQDRQAAGVHSLVTSDATSAEASRDFRMGDNSGQSSSSDWENYSIPEVSPKPTPPPPTPPSSRPTIEISPGVHVRLRGADETWKAVENDFYMPAECICCESTIFCIQNADYILCPDCRVVSRMEGLSSHGMGGVGLGFKYEDLARWQDAILRDQSCRRPQV
jgi:hypothetical protein